MAAKYYSVEEVRELVTEDTTDDNLDEDGELEESDGFEEVIRQKLEELAEFAAEIQPEFDEGTPLHTWTGSLITMIVIDSDIF